MTAMGRRAESIEEEERRKNLPVFAAAMMVYSCMAMAGAISAPRERRFRLPVGVLSPLVFFMNAIVLTLVQLEVGWLNPLNRRFFNFHVTSSLILFIIISFLVFLSILLD